MDWGDAVPRASLADSLCPGLSSVAPTGLGLAIHEFEGVAAVQSVSMCVAGQGKPGGQTAASDRTQQTSFSCSGAKADSGTVMTANVSPTALNTSAL